MSASTVQSINFDDLAPIHVQTTLGGKKYVLKEASGGAAIQYRNACIAASRLDKDGLTTRIEGLASAETLLVSLCLFQVVGVNPHRDVPIDMETIQSWRYAVQKKLYDTVMEISDGLREEDTVESLESQIKDAQERLSKLRSEAARQAARDAREDPRKNELGSTVDTSSSAES